MAQKALILAFSEHPHVPQCGIFGAGCSIHAAFMLFLQGLKNREHYYEPLCSRLHETNLMQAAASFIDP